jgi:uncharacterized protein YdcH (DUF465 family)
VNARSNLEARMPITPYDIRQVLLENDQEFRKLAEEHSRCESQLEQLVSQSYWNVEDLALEVSLKKIKLRLKDQMEIIVARHRQNGAQHRAQHSLARH